MAENIILLQLRQCFDGLQINVAGHDRYILYVGCIETNPLTLRQLQYLVWNYGN